MKIVKYTDLLDPSHKGTYMHERANWSAVGIDDIVEIPNIFSFRVVFWDIIKETGKKRALELGATFQYRSPGPENTETQIRFHVPETGGGAVATPTPPKTLLLPGHRGSYYGPDEGVFPLPGWNLISLPSRYTQEELSNFKVNDKYFDI